MFFINHVLIFKYQLRHLKVNVLQFMCVSNKASLSQLKFFVICVIFSYCTTDFFCVILYYMILDKGYRSWSLFLLMWCCFFFLQPYEINLQLTGLISRLAMLPHPYLHEYLLNPLLPLQSGANSLFSVLQLVAQELVSQIPTMKNYRRLLYNTRQKLLGDGSDMQ